MSRIKGETWKLVKIICRCRFLQSLLGAKLVQNLASQIINFACITNNDEIFMRHASQKEWWVSPFVHIFSALKAYAWVQNHNSCKDPGFQSQWTSRFLFIHYQFFRNFFASLSIWWLNVKSLSASFKFPWISSRCWWQTVRSECGAAVSGFA